MGKIDDKFILESEEKRSAGKRSAVYRWIAAAACFVMMAAVLTIPFLSHETRILDIDIDAPFMWNAEKGLFEYAAATESENNEIVVITKWDAMRICEKYKIFESGVFAGYNASCKEIGAAYVGEKLDDAVMRGYDVYEDKTYRIDASVYAIREVSSDCAVCVRYEGEDGYYVFFNSEAKFATLGEFQTGFGLEYYLVFRNSFSEIYWREDRAENGIYKINYYHLFDLSPIYGLIFSGPEVLSIEVKNQDYIEIMESSKNSVSIAVDCLSTGQENVGIQIYDSGYLVTNIGATLKVFEIGNARAAAMIDYIRTSGEAYEVIISDDRPAPAGTESGGRENGR